MRARRTTVLALLAALPAAAAAQPACKGTKQWYEGACRYPDEIAALKAKAKAPAVPRRKGLLTLTTVPPGATLYLSGKEVGKTPFGPAEVDHGIHIAIIRLDRYRRVSTRLTVREDRPLTETRVLEPLPGLLAVISDPLGARALLDGRELGTTPTVPEPVPAGPHTVRVELAGYQAVELPVEAGAERGTLVRAELPPLVEEPSGPAGWPFVVGAGAAAGAGAGLALGVTGREPQMAWLGGGGGLALVGAVALTWGLTRLDEDE